MPINHYLSNKVSCKEVDFVLLLFVIIQPWWPGLLDFLCGELFTRKSCNVKYLTSICVEVMKMTPQQYNVTLTTELDSRTF